MDENKKKVTPQQTECDNTVNACIAIVPPPEFIVNPEDVLIAFNANLACHLGTPFSTTCTTTIDGCNPVTGMFEVTPVYLTGCIDVILSISVAGTCSSEGAYFSVVKSIAVNNVVCLASTTSDPVCTLDPICPILEPLTIEGGSTTTPCSITGYVANVVFTLPCPIA